MVSVEGGMSFTADIININEMENTMRTDITKINEKSPHTELTEGLMVFAGGTSKMFQIGEWRTNTPIFHEDLCKQCLLCAPVCPDGSIPVKDSKRGAFDYDHCKGESLSVWCDRDEGGQRKWQLRNVCQVMKRWLTPSVR